MDWTPWTRTEMAAILARDIPEGWVVNLGVGIPTLVANNLPAEREIIIHGEHGFVGMGPAPAPDKIDRWLINPSKAHVTVRLGGSFTHHADSFAMIRGGRIDLCVMGAFQVAENGDLANWTTSEKHNAPAVGGAMDLAVGAKRVWVIMDHLTKKGESKLVQGCNYPLTAPGVVRRIYTDLAVIDVSTTGFKVAAMVPGITLDELATRTAAPLMKQVPS